MIRAKTKRGMVVVVAMCWIAWGCTKTAPRQTARKAEPLSPGGTCSAIALTVDGRTVFGANLDYRLHARGQLFINPRGVHKTGTIPSTTGAYAEWVSSYASVTFNFVGFQFAWGGMNEKGLVMSTMGLQPTASPPPDERPVVDSGFWIQYLLDTCATVEDVIATDEVVRNITVDHYLIADRQGNAAVIEYVGGEFVVHTGDDLPVPALTNWFYDQCYDLWTIYGGDDDYSWMGEPLLERFCVAADRVSAFDGTTAQEAVNYAFETLDAVAGQRFSEHASQWSLVFDTSVLRAYFKTYADPNIRYVDLRDFPPWCGRSVQMLDIDAPLAGDVGPWFEDYSHSEALDHLVWFIDFWQTDLSPTWASQIIRHFESFSCEPPLRVRRVTRRALPGGARR